MLTLNNSHHSYCSLALIGAILLLIPATNLQALTPKTEQQKQSYALGVIFAKNLEQIKVDIDKKAFVEGIKSQIGLRKKSLNQQQIDQAMKELRQRMDSQKQQDQQAEHRKNSEEGRKYLAANRKIEGVKVTPSGLQYQIVRLGKGRKPKATDQDQVEVHYRGTFINGEEFDSSYKRQQTTTFPLNRVIAGWTEVLQLMPVGSKFKVAIPGNLAYGDQARPSIGPNRTLLFDIELISIK